MTSPMKRMQINKEKYQDFTVNLGVTKPENSDLNQSPEGKRRRDLLYDYQDAGKGYEAFQIEVFGGNYGNAV
jgi:hypothetical protein